MHFWGEEKVITTWSQTQRDLSPSTAGLVCHCFLLPRAQGWEEEVAGSSLPLSLTQGTTGTQPTGRVCYLVFIPTELHWGDKHLLCVKHLAFLYTFVATLLLLFLFHFSAFSKLKKGINKINNFPVPFLLPLIKKKKKQTTKNQKQKIKQRQKNPQNPPKNQKKPLQRLILHSQYNW